MTWEGGLEDAARLVREIAEELDQNFCAHVARLGTDVCVHKSHAIVRRKCSESDAHSHACKHFPPSAPPTTEQK